MAQTGVIFICLSVMDLKCKVTLIREIQPKSLYLQFDGNTTQRIYFFLGGKSGGKYILVVHMYDLKKINENEPLYQRPL